MEDVPPEVRTPAAAADPPDPARPTGDTPVWPVLVILVGVVALAAWGLASPTPMSAAADARRVAARAERQREAAALHADKLAAVLPPGATEVRELGPGWLTFRLAVEGASHCYLMRYAEGYKIIAVQSVVRAD